MEMVQNEFETLMQQSDAVTRGGKTCKTKEQKELWWERRRELDESLGSFLKSLETCCFGAFKVSFLRNQTFD
jgi:hypothetical protein